MKEKEKCLTQQVQQLEIQVQDRIHSVHEKEKQLQFRENQMLEWKKEIKTEKDRHDNFSILKRETELC